MPASAVHALPASRSEFLGHPFGLFVLSCTEMWERMCFYGMSGILALYLTRPETAQVMGWGNLTQGALNDVALSYVGWYFLAVYLTPAFGGRIADRFIGRRKAILIGGLFMALGQFLIAAPESLYPAFLPAHPKFYLIAGMALTVIGNGFFKPNISALIGELYPAQDKRRESAFTIFYMGINIGALIGFLLIGWIGEKIDYHAGFFTAGVGMLIGLCVQLLFAEKYLGDIGKYPTDKADLNTKQATLTRQEIRNIVAIFIFSFFHMIYMIAFAQSSGSLNLFAKEATDLNVLGLEIPASWLQSVNPIAIILMAPLFSMFWLKRNDNKTTEIGKAAYAFLFIGAAFVIAGAGASLSAMAGVKAGVIWIILCYVLMTAGELCIAPVGLSMVSRYAPARFTGLAMGVFFMFTGIGGKIAAEAGKVANLSAQGYTDVFYGIAILSFITALIIFLLKGRIAKLTVLPQP